MQYTAIIKDGGLFIPNVFSDLDDGGAHIVQVSVDMEAVRVQLDESDAPAASKAPKKPAKRAPKKTAQKPSEDADTDTLRTRAVDELEALDDSELSEMLKAYMNEGHTPKQISLDNL